MAEISSPRQVDTITAPPRVEPKGGFSALQAPAQAAKKRRVSRRWLKRIIVAVIMLIPLIAVAVALLVVRSMYQPQSLHRTHITPVTPKAAASTTKKS